MTADRKAARERAEWVLAVITDPGRRNLAAAFLEVSAELEQAKNVIAWANNSLFGSHGFFLSDRGGPPNEHHLDEKIEELKSESRKQYQRAADLQRRLEEVEAAANAMEHAMDYGDENECIAAGNNWRAIRALSAQPNAAAAPSKLEAEFAAIHAGIKASAAPDAALIGLELAAKICEGWPYADIPDDLLKANAPECDQCAWLIRAEITRRTKGPLKQLATDQAAVNQGAWPFGEGKS